MTLRKWLLGAVSIAALIAGSLAAPPTHASDGSTVIDPDQQCAVHVQTGETLCVPQGEDLPAAWKAKTGRSVVDAATMPEGGARAVESDFLMAQIYDDIDYGGGSYSFYNSNYCTSGVIYWNTPAAWVGRASSAKGFSFCKVKVFQYTNMGGPSLGYSAAIPWFGALSDNSRSISVTA